MSKGTDRVFETRVEGFGMVRIDGREIKPPKDGKPNQRVCLLNVETDRRLQWVPVTRLSATDRERLGV